MYAIRSYYEYSLPYLSSVIADRFANPKPGSYTATLTPERVREKIEEEAEELIEAEDRDESYNFV